METLFPWIDFNILASLIFRLLFAGINNHQGDEGRELRLIKDMLNETEYSSDAD